MVEKYTVTKLFDDFVAERNALGYVGKTTNGAVRRFLQNFPEDSELEFTKEYVLENTKRRLNQGDNAVLREVSAVNCFLDFAIRKGFKAYKIPPKSLPKEKRNFRARIFSDDEINRIISAADATPFKSQSPDRHLQIPVIFRILVNCGLRVSEVLNLKLKNVNMDENILIVLDTKFHKNRLVPFSDEVAVSLKDYLDKVPPNSGDDYIFRSPKTGSKYADQMVHVFFRDVLYRAGIPCGGRGIGPRPHDMRHTFAVHCLNNWALSGVDLMAALPVLSRYLGHSGIKGTQKYLQLTSQMYPEIVSRLEDKFGALIPEPGVRYEAI
ncbi:MAG: tyrosine-type recombinase/integrase [Clostridiales bacterium]|jgi:integrase|nr:tyrosine-type recombinase/integrase [Clostridiales bacterium]